MMHNPRARAPLLANVPHSSTLIPSWVRMPLLLTDHELEAELLRMTDRYVDELFGGVEAIGGTSVVYRYSRLVVDPERFEDEEKEIMVSVGMGVIYTKDSLGRPLRAGPPSPEERARLLDVFYRPYHRELDTATHALLDEFGKCLILDCHSFPSQALPYELDQDPHRPDICLGTDSFHTPLPLIELLEGFLRSYGLTVVRNRPFEGTYVPLRFLGKDPRARSIMIEINRRLYMNEETGEKLDSFVSVRRVMDELVRLLVSHFRGWPGRSSTRERWIGGS
jgi:N-formylglutamate deformylase